MPAKPKPTKDTSEKAERKRLEKQLEKLSRELVNWRDTRCVLFDTDGARCSSVLQWGHFIPQAQSYWMRYAVGNTFKQCSAHNTLHYRGDQTFINWYVRTFGEAGHTAIVQETARHRGQRQTVAELRELVSLYESLLDNRPSVYDLAEMIRRGFYGDFLTT